MKPAHLHLFLGLIVIGLPWPPQPAAAASILPECFNGKQACNIGNRSYWVLPPKGWDGKTPLPAVLYFHGWGRQGNVPVNHQHIGHATDTAGYLLIAPDGLGKSWDFWRPNSRDTEFGLAVLEQVSQALPVDQDRIYASGYSWGGSMAWRFACEAGDKIAALISISGTLYDQDEACETGPVSIHHVHGTKDTVMDYPYGPQGEEIGAVRLWLRINGCSEKAAQTENWQTSQSFKRYSWTGCASGRNASLDVHQGGHWIAKGWLVRILNELSHRADPVEEQSTNSDG